MKKITLSIMAIAAMGTSLMAGGDIAPEPSVQIIPTTLEQKDDSGFYIGGAYTYQHSDVTDYSYGGMDVDVDSNNIMLLAGYDFNKYIAIEGRYTFSVGSVDLEDPYGKESSSDYDTSNWGIYVKPQYSWDNGFGVYALLGYGHSEFENLTETGKDDGFQWGLGAKYSVTSNISVFVDYVDLVNSGDMDGIEASPGVPANLDVDTYAWNFGVTYKF